MLSPGTDHPSNQKDCDNSGGKKNEGKEDCNIREANAGPWRGADVKPYSFVNEFITQYSVPIHHVQHMEDIS